MSVFNVPGAEWSDFLQDFTRLHRGQAITIEVLDGDETDPETKRRVVIREAPLQSIGTDPDREDYILIYAGEREPAGPQLAVHAERLRLEQSDEDGPGRLRIDAAEDEVVFIQLPVPVLPGVLNGW